MHAPTTCGRARKAPSVWAAESGSLNASAAVLLSATMRVRAVRSRRRNARYKIESATTIPNPAIKSAAAVAVMVTITSFCRIGLSRKICISMTSILFFNTFGNTQKLGTQLQRRALRPGLMNIETHAAILDYESDHAPVANEVVAVTDR